MPSKELKACSKAYPDASGHGLRQRASASCSPSAGARRSAAPFRSSFSLGLTKLIHIPGLSRYDLLLLICLAAQAALIWTRLETWDELKVITLFHLIGLALELFKVNMGSWSYPGDAWSKLGGVPLYSGFMYASVASYICQAWRRLGLRFRRWPNSYAAAGTALLIYANFFTHHWLPDLRWWLTALLALLFWRTTVSYAAGGKRCGCRCCSASS